MRLLKRVWILALFLTCAAAAGCRQPDGDMPPRTGDVPQRLVDLGRDLAGVTSGDPQAVTEMTDDLLVFVEEPEGMDAVRAMSAAVCPMLVRRTLTTDAQTQLATLLWTTVAARQFSERQVDKLKEDMREQLMSIGVSQQDANYAAGWVGTVQKAVATRRRHWYERY
jgi:hypothetical protein